MKCRGIWLGSNKGNPRKPLWFEWNSDATKILGYTYGQNTNQTWEQNWEKVRKKIKEHILKWENLLLSLIGKKIVINQVMLSKIWYLEYLEKLPADIIQNIRRDIHDFFWNYGNVKTSRNTIMPPTEMGGLAIMDIESIAKPSKARF